VRRSSITEKDNVILIFSIGSCHILENEDGFVCISPMVMLLNRGLMKLSWKS